MPGCTRCAPARGGPYDGRIDDRRATDLVEAPGTIAEAQREFDAEVSYLDTATLGLPPRRSYSALQRGMQEWRGGTFEPVAGDAPLGVARAAYARMVSVETASVAVGTHVSTFVGLVAASLPARAEVLTVEGDFTSLLFPFHVQGPRGLTVREVPPDCLVDAVTPSTALVAVSAVQSSDGRVLHLDALHAACEESGTRVLLDTTQAVGWLPIDASRFAYTVCGGYKWLLAPRGTAYFTVQPQCWEAVIPHAAGWYAGEEPWSSLYGSPLRLARDARRFDVSPVWHAWIAAAPALELLAGVGTAALHRHAVEMANRFCVGIGRSPENSAIVAVPVTDGAVEALRAARTRASVRKGRVRLAFHLYNDEQDVDHAADVLSEFLRTDEQV